MKVLFTSKIEGEIAGFQPYSFQEAVEKTAQLDAKWKKRNAEPAALDFMISNDEGDKLYSGTYEVGSADTTNLYDHVCRKLVQLPMKHAQQETERDILLQHLTSHTPPSYQLDVTELLKEDKAKENEWKQLSKRAKVIAGSLAGVAVMALCTSFVLFFTVNSQSKAIQDMDQQLAQVSVTKDIYATAMAGDTSEAISQLQAKEKRSENEQEALIRLLVEEKNYKEAVQQAGKENISVLAGFIMQLHGVEGLQAFHKTYPSPAGAFEIAYHTENYEEAVKVADVPMTAERYKEKGLAYLELDQPQEAKKMASEAKSDTLNEKINTYETLEEQIVQLDAQIQSEKEEEDEDTVKIHALEEEKTAKQEKQNNI